MFCKIIQKDTNNYVIIGSNVVRFDTFLLLEYVYMTCFAKTRHLRTPCQRIVFTING